ncbi:hypothetical protein JST99_01230 [Candidatus Dependentiae bacterium]|nr:hypothetical protein [Candidatus Dependentiae bacterium]
MKIRRNKMIDVTTVLLSCCLCVAPMLQAVDTAATSGAAVANSLLLPPGNACTLQQPSTQPQLVYLVPSQPAPQPAQPTVQSGRGFAAEFFLQHPVLTITAIGTTVTAAFCATRLIMSNRRKQRIDYFRERSRILRDNQLREAVNTRASQASVDELSQEVGAANNRLDSVAANVATRATQASVDQGFSDVNSRVSAVGTDVATRATQNSVNELALQVNGLAGGVATANSSLATIVAKQKEQERLQLLRDKATSTWNQSIEKQVSDIAGRNEQSRSVLEKILVRTAALESVATEQARKIDDVNGKLDRLLDVSTRTNQQLNNFVSGAHGFAALLLQSNKRMTFQNPSTRSIQ